MNQRKATLKYYFSVEGQTEKWYLDWLQGKINAEPSATYAVKLDAKVEKDPLSRVKSLTVLGKTKITHVCDVESQDKEHVQQFQSTLKKMKKASSASYGKTVQYQLGYSNFTFELWMILHKTECHTALTHRNQYLALLNRAFSEKFDSLDQYKQEVNFKRLLGTLSLENVVQAIKRAKAIMQKNESAGYIQEKYGGYGYYKENPSLSVWEAIETIVTDCEIAIQ